MLRSPITEHYLRYGGATARASVNTFVMRGYSLMDTVGIPGVTFAASATLGDSWTVDVADYYTISATLRALTGGGTITIVASSVLDNTILTSPQTRTAGGATSAVALQSGSMSWTGKLVVGDIIRVCATNGIATFDNSVALIFNQVSIRRAGKAQVPAMPL